MIKVLVILGPIEQPESRFAGTLLRADSTPSMFVIRHDRTGKEYIVPMANFHLVWESPLAQSNPS